LHFRNERQAINERRPHCVRAFAILLPMKKLNFYRIWRGIAGWFKTGPLRVAREQVGREESIRHLDRVLDRRKATASAVGARALGNVFGDFQLAEFKGAPTDAA
jgi:hypothetical protein